VIENLVACMEWLTAQIADMAVFVVNQMAAMEAKMVAMAAMDNQLTATLWKPKWLPWPPWTTG
jgi:hypothetical protein